MTIKHVNFGFNGDDDWEEEPYRAPTSAPQAPQRPPAALDTRREEAIAQTLRGSSFVSMEVDAGLLPVAFEFTSNWQYQVSPHEVGRELLNAYNAAVARRLAYLTAASGGYLGPDYSHSHFLSSRARTILLLEAETWDEYSRLQAQLYSFRQYHAHGSATVNDEPAVSILGDLERIRSIQVWSQWSGCADSYQIEGEIFECVHRIRASQPRYAVRRDWSRYTDEQLTELKDAHRRNLIESTRS
ncbi:MULTISPECIES: hypothetical protein [unclassified Nocardia]|uniref:hypothetical protein n=1 Tax=unclassified Nocardia TaxID=2637762 RepID=UPI00278C55BE|nr:MULTISPECIES: hypothetical protein [unclassified Nocardia]